MDTAPPTDTTGLPADTQAAGDTMAYWKGFGFEPIEAEPATGTTDLAAEGPGIGWRLPKGLVGFSALRADAADIGSVLEAFPVQHSLALTVGVRSYFYFRVDHTAGPFTGRPALTTVQFLQAGDVVPLPLEIEGQAPRPPNDIAPIEVDIVNKILIPRPDPEIVGCPLIAYSLRGQAAEFERLATETKPLLGDLCMSGQATIWFAPPNAGKTLLALKLVLDAVASGRINPANIYYVNADDSSSGFAEKMRLMDDLGAHTLAPGHKGLKAESLIVVLNDVATRDKARGALIILDTVKKFASLMDKAKASAFAQSCRHVVMQGGTILGLAHTTKNPNSNGSLRYAGTTDMVDDFDAAYVMTPLNAASGDDENVVRFDLLKRRGDNVDRVAYAYAGERSISYAERLASVRAVDPGQLDKFQTIEAERSDAEVIKAVVECIGDDVTAKMVLAKAVAKRARTSERAAIRVIEAYTGDDPAKHRWSYTVKDRGAKVFALLPRPDELAT